MSRKLPFVKLTHCRECRRVKAPRDVCTTVDCSRSRVTEPPHRAQTGLANVTNRVFRERSDRALPVRLSA